MLHSSQGDFADQVLVHPKETEGASFLEKAFETHDISQVLYLVKNVKTPNDCQFILEEFKKYCKKFHTENTNIFLEVLAANLVPVSTSSEEDFVEKCKPIQTSFHKKLCTDGLRKVFAIQEINTLTQKNLDTISTDEETQKKLLALIKWCSGVPKNAKNSNDYIFDSNKLRINFLGLTDFNDIEELFFLLSKLNPYFSHIQKLLSHYIVFTIIKKSDDYGYDLDKGSVAKSINFYLDNCCDNETKTILLKYKDLLHNYKTSSPYSLIKQINSLIANTVFPQKESIINHIAEYMSKSPAELKNTEMEYKKVDAICRAFTEISTKFYQSFDVHKWRGKCFVVNNPDVAPELLAHNGKIDLMAFFIKKEILSYPTQQKQAQALNLFLLVAREAFHNRPDPQIVAPDFTTAAAVHIANISYDISNLKLTPLLDKPAKKIEKALSILVSPQGRFKEFHMLQAADHRILPFTAAIFKKKDFMYEFDLYNVSEDLGEMFATLMFIKNRLVKVVFLDNSSDLEDQLQQLKNQMLENDVPVRKPSSERQRLSLAPSKEVSRKLSVTEYNAPRKKSTPEKKLPKITSLEDSTLANVEHPDEEIPSRRTSAPRKTSSGRGTSPHKELQENPSLKNLAAETQRLSERKVPKLLRRLSGENRHSNIIHSEKQQTSPLSPREKSSSSEDRSPLQNDHPEQEGHAPPSKHHSFKDIFRYKFTVSADDKYTTDKSSTDKSSTDKSSASSPRTFPNPSTLFQSSSSSSSEDVKPNADATLKKKFS